MNDIAPAIAIEGLHKRFTGPDGKVFDAVGGVSLNIAHHAITALVGPDGAGKTTLIRMINGLLKPDGGNLTVLGIDVGKDPQSVQDRISYMPQRFGLYEDLSVQENLDLYADLHGVAQDVRRERFARLMEMTDLARFTARPAGKLSGGMKQKLGLACTLVRAPDLLLLDEPSVGVDPLSRRDLWEILNQLIADDPLSVVVSTAYMDEAERCDEVFVFDRGHLLASGPPEELRKRADGLTYVARPPQGQRARLLQARLIDATDAIVDAVPKGGEVWFSRRPECDEAQVSGLLPGAEVEPRKADLEDSFMLLLREHAQARDEEPVQPSQPLAVQDDGAVPSGDEAGKPVVVVRDLVRKFGDFTAVDRVSFTVNRGEIFGLLGPNGAGKTTTFRMLCGLLPATSGELEVAGRNLRTARARARARIGYVSQKFALYGDLTVRENLQFFAGAYGLRGSNARQRVSDLIDQYALQGDARSGMLPVGYKQRLAMAAALVHEPDILFLDEPTSGIDPLARRAFWRTITTLAQQGVTVIVTTHFMEEAEFCDRILIQDAGRMLALGTPHEVREQAGDTAAQDMNSAFIAIVEASRHHERAAA